MLTPSQIVNDPKLFAFKFLKILDKEKVLVPFSWNRAQEHFHKTRTGRDIILKARQLGFSTYVQGEMFRRTVTKTRTTITLAHDADTTSKLRLMADRFWEHCKFNDIQPSRKYANSSLTTYPELDSACTIATAGNVETGRGDTYTDLHGSEVAFWKDAEKIIAGAMQGGSPDVILESTPNGTQGYFYENCMEALAGKSIWTVHFYPWWWDDGYRMRLQDGEVLEYTEEEKQLALINGLSKEQINWRRYKQKELKAKFKQEYPEDPVTCFLTSGDSFFGDMTGVFIAPFGAVYDPTHEYAAGIDWGRDNDYTVIIVKDKTAHCMVEMLRVNQMEWGEMRRRVAAVCKKWHVRNPLAEANSIGSVNIEELRKLGVSVIPFDTTNQSKSDVMSDLYEAIHAEHTPYRLQDDPVLKHEMNSFVSTQTYSNLWRLAAEGEGHDDTVIALALSNTPVPGWLEFAKQQAEEEKKKRDIILAQA